MDPDKKIIESLKLDNQLCFRLYAASRLTTKLYKPLLDAINLTYPQYLVMLVLWENDHIDVKTIGKKLFLNSNTLTPLLKKLEARNLITRTRSKEDERQVLITLTANGQHLKYKSKDIPQDLYQQIVQSGHINSEDFIQMKDLLDKVITAIS